MRITFVLPSETTTGGVRVIYEYANRLSGRGHDVTVVVPAIPPYPLQLFLEQGPLTLVQKVLSASNSGPDWNHDANVLRLPALRRPFLDRVPDADVVITSSWRSAPAVCRLPDSAGRPFHLVQHYEAWPLWNERRCWRQAEEVANKQDLPIPVAMAAISPGFRYKGYKRRVDEALALPTTKIAVSGWLSTMLEEVFNQQSKTIANGISHETFYPEPVADHTTDLEGSMGRSITDRADTIRVLAPYRTAQWKGTADAVSAFRSVRHTREDVQFEMFGSSSSASDLPSWVIYHSRLSDAELRQLYSSVDVFVFPSWTEGFGLPPLEAMACRTTVLSTDVGVIRESVDDGVVKVPIRDPEALAQALLSLLDNPDLRTDLAEAGRNSADRFRWRDSVSKIESALMTDDESPNGHDELGEGGGEVL